MEIHAEAFMEEAQELLGELETSLLEMEENPDDIELIGRVFRAMHTIKGSGAMFGFDNIAKFTHEVETVFDLVRNGKMAVTKELISLTLAARDLIRAMLDEARGGEAADETAKSGIIISLKKLVSASVTAVEKPAGEAPAAGSAPPASEAAEAEMEATYRIRFKPYSDIFKSGTNPIPLLNEIRGFGECTIVAHIDDLPELREIDPESCYSAWDIILTTSKDINAVRDVFIFVEDACELKIDVIDESYGIGAEKDYKKLGEILLERGDLTTEALRKALGTQKRIGEVLVDAGLVEPGHIESALLEQKHIKNVREKKQAAETATSIRVSSEKLDQLVNLVGEMVTVQARLSQLASFKNDSDLTAVSEEVERLTGELRDNAMGLRMLPIGTTFSKFRRLVRDLSAELGKEIELKTEGAETELDKTVIEKLNDPLVHLIRNSIDHGIERPEVREQAGKPRQGTILLSAIHSGSNVLIRIRDDGQGLDPDAIRAKAIEKGLIADESSLSEGEIYSLILAPGFSTAKVVTSVSGRGVGMDVVKKTIDSLGGSIEISSKKGSGSEITLKLPLTLAIIEGLLVKVAAQYYVLQLSAVEECIELTKSDIERSHGRHIANLRGQIVPYIRLREWFNVTGGRPSIEQIVIVGTEGRRTGFVVDDVIGEHQTVIKSLGRAYRDVKGISGATILGDGTVALIIDIVRLIDDATTEEIVLQGGGMKHQLKLSKTAQN